MTRVLVIISPGFPAHEEDTTCLPAVQTFVKSVNRLYPDLQVIIIALQYPLSNTRYQWFNNSVIPLHEHNIPKILRPRLWLKIYRELSHIPRNKMLGVLSLWYHDGALVGRYFARWNRVKHLCWVSGQDARAGNTFVKLTRLQSSEIVAISDFVADQLEQNHGVRPAHIVPNGINPDDFDTMAEMRTVDLLAVGSLIPLKQYSVFIDVVSALVRIKPSLKAVLCGAGPDELALKNKIAKLKIENNITLTGELTHHEVLAQMKRAKIFVHPSLYEGYSTVCLEALGAGCHVVSLVAAEHKPINHWHIASGQAEMIQICEALLTNETDFSPTVVHHMDNSVKKMIELFLNSVT